MSCTPTRTFKRGDTLSIPMRIYDRTGQKGYPLGPDTQITSRLNDMFGNLIVDMVAVFYPDQDQDANAGWFLLQSPPNSPTDHYPLGEAKFDVRLTTPALSKTFKTENLEILMSETPTVPVTL